MNIYKSTGLFLFAYALPTLIIGFVWVIPGSCIEGINEFTIGFVGAVFGSLPIFLAVTQPKQCSVRPNSNSLLKCLNEYINLHASHPRGLLGYILGWLWRYQSGSINDAALDLLDLKPGDHVLEVGCGSGLTIKKILNQVSESRVTGLDVSPLMIEMATRTNKCSFARKRLRLAVTKGEVPDDLPLFDKILSVHSIYFWQDPEYMLLKLSNQLRPGGKIVIAAKVKDEGIPARYDDPTYRFYKEVEITDMLKDNDLKVDVKKEPDAHPGIRWFIGQKAE